MRINKTECSCIDCIVRGMYSRILYLHELGINSVYTLPEPTYEITPGIHIEENLMLIVIYKKITP